MRTNTNEYERTHGRKPRGTGMWLFKIGNRETLFASTGTYTEAKKSATFTAKHSGEKEITVMP